MLRLDNKGMIKHNYVKKTVYQSQLTIAVIKKQYIHKKAGSHSFWISSKVFTKLLNLFTYR